jgi:hypothetical protein
MKQQRRSMDLMMVRKILSVSLSAAIVLAGIPGASAALVETIDLPAQNRISAGEGSLFLPGVPAEEPMLLAFGDSTTGMIVNRLKQGEAECGALPAEFRADCMAQTFRSAASATGNRPDYTGAQTELNRASRSLSSLVSQNADPSVAPLRKGAKTYRAVKKAAVRAVNQKAVAIIQESETKLLRSAGSGLRKTHYQRIAQAVGSTKRIFRS